MEIGTKVHALTMSPDSHYLEVKGTVTGVRNGRVQINATEVKDRWSKKWKAHPTSCACSAAAAHVVRV